MRTFILVKRDSDGNIVELAGPCTEKDSTNIKEENFELIDELLFKTLHPERYKELLLNDLTPAIYAWIDQLYANEIDLIISGNVIIADHFIIEILSTELHIMFYSTCSSFEAANLVLHLRANIFEDMTIAITEIPPLIVDLCKN